MGSFEDCVIGENKCVRLFEVAVTWGEMYNHIIYFRGGTFYVIIVRNSTFKQFNYIVCLYFTRFYQEIKVQIHVKQTSIIINNKLINLTKNKTLLRFFLTTNVNIKGVL